MSPARCGLGQNQQCLLPAHNRSRWCNFILPQTDMKSLKDFSSSRLFFKIFAFAGFEQALWSKNFLLHERDHAQLLAADPRLCVAVPWKSLENYGLQSLPLGCITVKRSLGLTRRN
jgi:hypothetical protein